MNTNGTFYYEAGEPNWVNYFAIQSTSTINDNVWHHIAVKRSGTTITILVDGSVENSRTFGITNLNNTYSVHLGKDACADQPWGEYFKGSMDEVRIWNYARSNAAIANNRQCTLDGSETGLVADYSFSTGIAYSNNAGLNTLTDQSPNGNDGTLNNFTLDGTTSNWAHGNGNDGTICDLDTDGDGLTDDIDNCPTSFNPGQADADNDGIGDACDPCPNGDIPVQIVQSELPEYCQGGAIVLSTEALDVASYSWSNGGTDASTEVFSSDTYSVTITNTDGCPGTAEITVDYVAQDLVSAYTIIGMDEVHLHGENVVSNGGVGVMNANKKAKIHDNTTIAGATTFVMADKIEIKDGSTVTTQIIGQPSIVLPTFLYGTPGTEDVTVDENTTMVLTGSAYHKVEVKKNATVIFTQNDISVYELKTKDGATVEFNGCTYLRLSKKLKLYKDNTFNPQGYKVTVFVEGYKAEIKEGTTFNGSIYAIDHDVKVKGKSNNPTYMNGFYIGKKIHGNKNVIWDWSTNCGTDCPDIIPNNSSAPVIVAEEEDSSNDYKSGENEFTEIINEEPQLRNFPNPFKGRTTIEFTLVESSHTRLTVYNSLGKEIATLYNGMAEPGQAYTLEFNGENLPVGLYYYHLQSGSNLNITTKLMLVR